MFPSSVGDGGDLRGSSLCVERLCAEFDRLGNDVFSNAVFDVHDSLDNYERSSDAIHTHPHEFLNVPGLKNPNALVEVVFVDIGYDWHFLVAHLSVSSKDYHKEPKQRS